MGTNLMSSSRFKILIAMLMLLAWITPAQAIESAKSEFILAPKGKKKPAKKKPAKKKKVKKRRRKNGEKLPQLGEKRDKFQITLDQVKLFNPVALQRAINDLSTNHPDKYTKGAAHTARLNTLKKQLKKVINGLKRKKEDALKSGQELLAFQREVLLSNPLLDFEKIVLVKRRKCKYTSYDGQTRDYYGMPQNWQGNTSMHPNVWDSSLVSISLRNKAEAPHLIHKAPGTTYIGDMDLNFDADKMLFSGIDSKNNWQVYQINTNGSNLKALTNTSKDIANYDPVYLPDGRIIYAATSGYQGVPCVAGKDFVGNLQIMNADGTNTRQLCFDQDNDWCPTVLNNGKIIYLRWEYTDSAHYFSRVLMQMNPDGTGQREFYGSNSYWPNSLFDARPIPGSPSKFIGIVSGHHGARREGELVLFDTALGRTEATGAVQRIPGFGKKVIGPVKDQLVRRVWPKFLYPYPISDKYFIVSCKTSSKANWGLYLVDVWDNMLLLREDPNYSLFEAKPLRTVKRPPVIPDRVRLDKKTATVFINNVNEGRRMQGVPKGVVKAIRVFQYEYAYRYMGGHYTIGMEGCWDVKRVLGTVPVYEDGSAMFTIPANVPISLQPIDAEGKAVQQMRSWMTAMPGEFVSCVGCHEDQGATPLNQVAIASRKQPVTPKPFYGKTRGFSFLREVQPVLDKYCAGCHDGSVKERPNFADNTIDKKGADFHRSAFSVSYDNLHPYVRRTGPEGDYTGLLPGEFHADTSELIQILQKGHHNVKLDPEAWERLITWVDLNVPFYGTWSEASTGVVKRNVAKLRPQYIKKRYEYKKKYSGVDENIEDAPAHKAPRPAFVKPEAMAKHPAAPQLDGWPLANATEAQKALGETAMNIDLGNGVKMALRKIPSGRFVMGSTTSANDEYPAGITNIDKPFWMAETEVSLQQFKQFRKTYKNGYYDMHMKDQIAPGFSMDKNQQNPVIRISWEEANAFCKWLSNKIGKKVKLPNEAQWEWAARAGTATAFSFGDVKADYSTHGNMGDYMLKNMATNGRGRPERNPNKYKDYLPKDVKVNDGVLHLAPVNKYKANPWGLKQMNGNVAEWTSSLFLPYPFDTNKADIATDNRQKRVVRGGSWHERARFCTNSYRLAYPAWQRVYNVGFRIIIETE